MRHSIPGGRFRSGPHKVAILRRRFPALTVDTLDPKKEYEWDEMDPDNLPEPARSEIRRLRLREAQAEMGVK